MKAIKNISKAILCLMITTTGLNLTYAQDQKIDDEQAKEALVRSQVNERNFVFRAQSATPVGGRFIQLTSEYDLRVTGDTLRASLPYFGRAYTAPIDPTRSGIQFTSTSFEYTATERKKGGWDITIKPNDTRDVQQLFLRISESGSASLQVISNNRQAISFNGYIRERSQRS